MGRAATMGVHRYVRRFISSVLAICMSVGAHVDADMRPYQAPAGRKRELH